MVISYCIWPAKSAEKEMIEKTMNFIQHNNSTYFYLCILCVDSEVDYGAMLFHAVNSYIA